MVRVKFLGHAAVLLQGTYTIIIDPYIEDNPYDISLKDIPKVDFILVTHGHKDHLGDAIALSERDNAPIVAIYELAVWLESQGAKTIPMNFGGTLKVSEDLAITLVPAVHSGNVVEDKIYPTGNPGGFIVYLDGRRFYHAGDTMVFSDMQLFPELFGPIDVAFLPIGGLYTMDVKQAAYAARFLRPRIVVPIHYNTWDVIRANPEELKKLLEPVGIEVKILKPLEEFEI